MTGSDEVGTHVVAEGSRAMLDHAFPDRIDFLDEAMVAAIIGRKDMARGCAVRIDRAVGYGRQG